MGYCLVEGGFTIVVLFSTFFSAGGATTVVFFSTTVGWPVVGSTFCSQPTESEATARRIRSFFIRDFFVSRGTQVPLVEGN